MNVLQLTYLFQQTANLENKSPSRVSMDPVTGGLQWAHCPLDCVELIAFLAALSISGYHRPCVAAPLFAATTIDFDMCC